MEFPRKEKVNSVPYPLLLMLIALRAYLSPVCNSLFHGLWTSGGASHGKVFSLSFSLALRGMLQCPLCSKSLSVGLSLVTHLSIEFHWWSFVYLAILIMFCQTSSFFISELLTKKKTNKQANKQTNTISGSSFRPALNYHKKTPRILWGNF